MDDSNVTDYFINTVGRDVLATLVGEVIGGGVARVVYECPLRPDLVVKIETPSRSFQNIKEWDAWEYLKEAPKYRRWLAPCEMISPCGTVLVMKRTTRPTAKQWPRKLPAFLTDTKRDNYGILNGRFVCHDYGLLWTDHPLRLRNAKWWGD